MSNFFKSKRILPLVAGSVMLMASGGASAVSSGLDLDLTTHAAAGGMAGAAYTKPQEVSAALFGNPATLTQFGGISHNFNLTYLQLTDVKFTSTNTNTATGTSSNSSTSEADQYIVPSIATSLQLSPNLFVGLGLEVDAGLGADYRDDPLYLLGGSGIALLGAPIGFPLLVEVISFNANIVGAYKVTPDWSLGGAVTIGFGLGQLGTAGDTTGITALGGALGAAFLTDFGGTTSSVHDIGFGYSLGTTYEVMPGITTSATYKSEVAYNFKDILFTTVNGIGFQNLEVELPRDVIVGIAFEDVFMPNSLIEIDGQWKNWSSAKALKDAWENQFIARLGLQFNPGGGPLTLRAGYSYMEDMLKDTPNNTLGKLQGIGSLPLGTAANALGGGFSGLATDFVRGVQMSLLPTIWNHALSAGAGYALNPAASINVYGAYQFSESDSRTATGFVDTAVGGLVAGTSTTTFDADIDSEWVFGFGIDIKLP